MLDNEAVQSLISFVTAVARQAALNAVKSLTRTRDLFVARRN